MAQFWAHFSFCSIKITSLNISNLRSDYLEMTLQSNSIMTAIFFTHINQITSNANRSLGFVKRKIRITNQSVKALDYKTLVRPQVEYASTVWSPYTKQNIQKKKIAMVQRRVARWVSNSYSSYNSVSAMLTNLGWRSFEYRRHDSRLAVFYKIHYGLVAVPMPSYFERPIRITRSVSARYMFLPITGICFFLWLLFYVKAPCRLSSIRLSWLLQERSEQDQLFRAIESNVCFNPVFISSYQHFNTIISLSLSAYAFISHYKYSTFILTHPSHNTQ